MTKLHRFIGIWQLALGALRIDDEALAHQLRSVLKMKVGEMVLLADGTGQEAHCRIVQYDRGAVVFECLSIGSNASESALRATLFCAVLKADHFELAAQKATEVGVTEIVPVVTARTVKQNLRVDRAQKIVREAAEQSGRGIVPKVQEPRSFDEACTQASALDANYFFDPSGDAFGGVPKSVRSAGIWIGPEGGWEEGEVERARMLGMRIVSLGSFVLRAETAAIVAAYAVVHGMKK